MKRIYLCSNCGAPVAYGYRFCSNCGSKLDWIVQQIPLNSLPLMNDCQYPNQQPLWNQQPVQNQYQNQQKCDNHDVVPQNKSETINRTVTPMRNQIFKLLDELFDKPSKYN